jgi:hypothetical protein
MATVGNGNSVQNGASTVSTHLQIERSIWNNVFQDELNINE